MNNNRLLELMSRKLSGEATSEELAELEHVFKTDPEALSRYRHLDQYWNHYNNAGQHDITDAFERLIPKLDLPDKTPVKKSRFGRISFMTRAVAAASVILVSGSLYFIKKNPGNQEPVNHSSALIEKKNDKGVKSNIALSDGTKIWLNADTKIQYPKNFNGHTREVYLSGEAFFDVAKNAEKPFIIHLANGTVKVIGTSFNIRAYENEKTIETSVATGKVAFIPKYLTGRKQDTVFLLGNNKLRYLYTREEAIVEPTESNEDSAWIAGRLVFKDLSFDEIAIELERNFGKKIVFSSDSLRQYRMTGAFQNNSLEEILFYLSKSKEFKYQVNNEDVIINGEPTELP